MGKKELTMEEVANIVDGFTEELKVTSQIEQARINLAKELKSQREKLGLSINELAEKAGVLAPVIESLESADGQASVPSLIKYLVAVGLNINNIFNNQDKYTTYKMCPDCGCLDVVGWEEENPECAGCGNPYTESSFYDVTCTDSEVIEREVGTIGLSSFRILHYNKKYYEDKKKEWDKNPELNGDKNELEVQGN